MSALLDRQNAHHRNVIHRICQLLFGLAVGLIALLLLPGHHTGGTLVVSGLGMVGALAAGIAGERLRLYRAAQPAGFVMSVLGAITLVLIYGIFLH